jgi:hypothetical protein
MWFDVLESDINFTKTSPYGFENQAVLHVTPERAFEIATGDMTEWLVDYVGMHWTSAAPHGVGSTREVQLKMLTVKERFIVWEPGKRVTFTLEGSTMPLVRRMIEDLQFEAMPGGRTLLRWNVHYEPNPLMLAIHPIARAIFGSLFDRSAGKLAEVCARGA